MFYVYILKSNKEKLYYGFTSDLRRRLVEHNKGKSNFTKGSTWKLVYYEAYSSKKDALERELSLKHYGQGIRHLLKRISNSLQQN